MPRLSFGLASLWGGLTVLSFCGSASAQMFGSPNNCGCSAPTYMGPPPIMRQTAMAFGAAPMMPVSYANSSPYDYGEVCGPAVCTIDQPPPMVHMQAIALPPVTQTVVAVQQLQPMHQAVMQDIRVTEYQPVKRTVSKPVVKTEWVDQAVTVMTPVSELKTVNVASTDYQTVTEYKTIKKQGGYWVTQNIPTPRVSPYQYDNRPNAAGALNRATYGMRTAFTPPYQQNRTFVPQTMTCTIPCKKTVAVPGMKQVTYNVTRQVPTQTTRKVAVNRVVYETAEVTVMAPVQVTKTVQVGTRVSYVPPTNVNASATATNCDPSTGATALGPIPDPKASAAKPRVPQTADENGLDPSKVNDKTRGSLQNDDFTRRVSDASQSVRKFSAPSVVRVSQWVARTPSPSAPQPGGKSAAISLADSAR